MDLADSYFRNSQFENAIEQLHIALSNNPENLLALEMLGESNQQLERYNDAVNAYKKILSINPDDKKNMCNMAIAYTYQGKYTSAMSQINKALKIESNYGFAFLTRGIVYETCAEKCVAQNKQKISFDDKLVYKMAYDQFIRAKNDLEWKDDADRHIKFLETLIPTTEDKFLHSDHQNPGGACYEWIK